MSEGDLNFVLASLKETRTAIRVQGVPASAQALMVAKIAISRPDVPVIAVCPDDDTAATLAEDIETLSLIVFLKNNTKG